MTLSDYQRQSQRTLNVSWPTRDQQANAALGLAGEAGEVADLIKKWLYHGHDTDWAKLHEELGDVLFYVAAIATLYGLNLDDIAQANIDKLKARYPNGFTAEDSRSRADEAQP